VSKRGINVHGKPHFESDAQTAIVYVSGNARGFQKTDDPFGLGAIGENLERLPLYGRHLSEV